MISLIIISKLMIAVDAQYPRGYHEALGSHRPINPSNTKNTGMTRHILMIAYHFPPIHESSGLQRTLKFATYLRDHGWSPIILSISASAYPKTSNDQLGDIPNEIPVYRAFGLDAARQLSIAGRYPRFFALPDRQASWLLGGIWTGLKVIRKYKPAAIWSTYPIATAHRIGYWLNRLSGLPWVADFRDPMVQDGYPADPAVYRSFEKIEMNTITHCSAAVFATPGARKTYIDQYPSVAPEKFSVILNGYDEATFSGLISDRSDENNNHPLRLIHSGVLYPSERDPRQFFLALSQLKKSGAVSSKAVTVILRATGHDPLFQPMLEDLDIEDLVQLSPRVAYKDALNEMLTADGLLLFQAGNCNQQIPAKAYEYLRAQRPILTLTDPAGDTAQTIKNAGAGYICNLEDANDIREQLQLFIEDIQNRTATVADISTVKQFDRTHGATQLASLLDRIVDQDERSQI